MGPKVATNIFKTSLGYMSIMEQNLTDITVTGDERN